MNESSEKLPAPFDDGEVYDLVLKNIPYGFDFCTGLTNEARGPVLDVCCGTGRILLLCLQAGVDIKGLDLWQHAAGPSVRNESALHLQTRNGAAVL